jgi:hypothetical protein
MTSFAAPLNRNARGRRGHRPQCGAKTRAGGACLVRVEPGRRAVVSTEGCRQGRGPRKAEPASRRRNGVGGAPIGPASPPNDSTIVGPGGPMREPERQGQTRLDRCRSTVQKRRLAVRKSLISSEPRPIASGSVQDQQSKTPLPARTGGETPSADYKLTRRRDTPDCPSFGLVCVETRATPGDGLVKAQ